MSTERYYDIASGIEQRRQELPEREDDLIPFVRERFISTVKSHLIADVRVGSCLSGGLDSSSIVCVMDRLLSTGADTVRSLRGHIATFSSCHEDPRYDEQYYIDAVVSACRNAEPVKIFPSATDMASRLDKLIWHQDEPFTSASIYAQYAVMEAARNAGVTVLLDGQGGDELFAGYRKFFFFYMRDLARSGQLMRLGRELWGGVTRGDGDLFDFRAGRRYLPKALQGTSPSITSVLRPGLIASADLKGLASGATLEQRQILDIAQYSLPSLLRYEDRNSMAFGIEARVPFLDHALIETAIALPTRAKIRGGVSKWIMRQAMSGIVPDAVLFRRTKMGFVTPEEAWMTGPMRPLVEDMLSRAHPALAATVDIRALEGSYRQILAGNPSPVRPRELFGVLCLNRWMHVFGVTS